ncbi:hypothetical protein [Segatella copri]|uniref:hypothetical protein n=1 Tax=Segatella copri TaxID=165179 RepID=UPI002FEFDABC
MQIICNIILSISSFISFPIYYTEGTAVIFVGLQLGYLGHASIEVSYIFDSNFA